MVLLMSGPVGTEIQGLRRALGDGMLERVSPHVTLVPPVNVRDDEVALALEVLRAAAGAAAPLTLEIGPATSFLPTSSVLYLAVGGDVDALRVLHERVQHGPFDRPREFPFVAHVTLLQADDPARIAAGVRALADFRASVVVDRLHLLEEVGLESVGRVWRPIADFSLTRPAVVGRGGLELEITGAERLDPEALALVEREWEVLDAARFGPGTRWERHPFALTARRAGLVVGAATGWTGLGVGYLSELVVAEATRGEGTGSRLLAAFESLAARRECHRLALRTDSASRAPAFYEARGWRVEAAFTDWLAGLEFVQLRRDL